MGYGDNIMATGFARGAWARGKRIAFGDGKDIKWDHLSPIIFQGNPNIAPLGSEGSNDIEWVKYYRGHRVYAGYDHAKSKWLWNHDFRPIPGEIYFNEAEKAKQKATVSGFILMETSKNVVNKQWPQERYQAIADRLMAEGYDVMQFRYASGVSHLTGVRDVIENSFRGALAIMSQASLYLGPEGGLHHGAAALGIGAVAIYGGFIPPYITGYGIHTQITNATEFCGNALPCDHCKREMENISVEQVYEAVKRRLNGCA